MDDPWENHSTAENENQNNNENEERESSTKDEL